MTADIRTAAQREAAINVNFPLYHPSQHMPVDLAPFARSQFIEGAVWGAARVTPTREQIAEACEGYLSSRFTDPRHPQLEWVIEDSYGCAGAVLALMQELAGGENDE